MNQCRIDLTAVADIDPIKIGRPARILPYQPPILGSQTAIETALRAYCAAGFTGAPILQECLDFAHDPRIRLTFVGSIKKAPVRPHRDWTIAGGPSVSGVVGAGAGAHGGLYFWNKVPSGEIGWFGGISFVAATNIGVSLVAQVTYYFGSAPSCLAGTSLVIGVDIGGKILTGGGYLVISASPPPRLTGISFALGVGASILPVDLTVQVSKTWITP